MYYKVVDPKKHLHKEWIFIRSLDKIQLKKIKKTAINNSRKRTQKVMTQAEYPEADRQVKRSIRFDKWEYIDEWTVEIATTEGNMQQLNCGVCHLCRYKWYIQKWKVWQQNVMKMEEERIDMEI